MSKIGRKTFGRELSNDERQTLTNRLVLLFLYAKGNTTHVMEVYLRHNVYC